MMQSLHVSAYHTRSQTLNPTTLTRGRAFFAGAPSRTQSANWEEMGGRQGLLQKALSSGFVLALSRSMDLSTLLRACLPAPAGSPLTTGYIQAVLFVSESDPFRVVWAEPLGPQWHKSFYLHSSLLPRTEQGQPGRASQAQSPGAWVATAPCNISTLPVRLSQLAGGFSLRELKSSLTIESLWRNSHAFNQICICLNPNYGLGSCPLTHDSPGLRRLQNLAGQLFCGPVVSMTSKDFPKQSMPSRACSGQSIRHRPRGEHLTNVIARLAESDLWSRPMLFHTKCDKFHNTSTLKAWKECRDECWIGVLEKEIYSWVL